jgi:hypothetical protein
VLKKVFVVQGKTAEREKREDGGTNTKIQENNLEQEEGKNNTTRLFASAFLNERSSVKEQPDRFWLSNSVGTIYRNDCAPLTRRRCFHSPSPI